MSIDPKITGGCTVKITETVQMRFAKFDPPAAVIAATADGRVALLRFVGPPNDPVPEHDMRWQFIAAAAEGTFAVGDTLAVALDNHATGLLRDGKPLSADVGVPPATLDEQTRSELGI